MNIAQVAPDASIAPTSLHADMPMVYIVDDDAAAREGLESLISAIGWETRTFSSANQFLMCPRPAVPRCLILDVSLPDLDGLVLQERVAADRGETAVIFVTAHTDVATVVKAMKGGAIQFFTKPCQEDSLLDAVVDAIEQSRVALARGIVARSIRARYESLSRRERQVLTLVVAGRLNKQIADELAITEITVKAHRGKVMRKMEARSLADLVRMVEKLDLDGTTASEDSPVGRRARNGGVALLCRRDGSTSTDTQRSAADFIC